MTIKRLHTNARMSQAVIHNGLVYIAGQVAQNAKGGPIEDQTRDILATIDRLLAEAGSDKSRILNATLWLTDMADYAGSSAVWDAWVPEGCAPARACVEARLVAPEYITEIAVVAAVD